MKEIPNPEWEKATHRMVLTAGGEPLRLSMHPTPLPELVADREAIREALKESRKRHTVRVRSILP